MPRRPPHYPPHRGLIWRQFATGMPAERPLAEWVYVTPRYLEGLRQEDLEKEPPEKQTETAQIWFLSNYEPFSGQGLGHGSRPHGALPPQSWSADTILRDEFSGIISEIVLSELSTRLQAQADLWQFIPNLAPSVLSPGADGSASPQAAVEAALAQLDEAVNAVAAVPRRIGDNQFPSILDVSTQAKIVQATQQAREAVAGTAPSVQKTEEAQSKLNMVLENVSKGILFGVGKKVGEEAYDPAKPLVFEVFYKLLNAVATLARWISNTFS